MEDVNLFLKDALIDRPGTNVPSPNTILRVFAEQSTDNITYTAPKTEIKYEFNTAKKLNQLLVKLLMATGLLQKGMGYDVDFDLVFLNPL